MCCCVSSSEFEKSGRKGILHDFKQIALVAVVFQMGWHQEGYLTARAASVISNINSPLESRFSFFFVQLQVHSDSLCLGIHMLYFILDLKYKLYPVILEIKMLESLFISAKAIVTRSNE